jgi:hypothetical protein
LLRGGDSTAQGEAIIRGAKALPRVLGFCPFCGERFAVSLEIENGKCRYCNGSLPNSRYLYPREYLFPNEIREMYLRKRQNIKEKAVVVA